MPPACEKIQRMSRNFSRVAGKDDVADGAGRIGAPFDHPRRLGPHQVDAAIGRGGMGVDHDLAAVEFFHDGQEGGIAEPLVVIVRQQADAVELERVECVGDFLQAAVDVGQRQHRETSEAAGMVGDQPCCVFVALAHELARRLSRGEIDARLRHRKHRDRDTRLVHVGERVFRRPFPHRAVAEIVGDRGRDIARRRQVMVNVDTVWLRLGRLRRRALRTAQPDRCHRRGAGNSSHELTPAQRRAGQRKGAFAAACAASVATSAVCDRVRSPRPPCRSLRDFSS